MKKSSYRLDEVAKEMDVSRRTVERWIANGELQSIKIGHTRRVPSTEIEKKSDNFRQIPTITEIKIG